MTIIHSYFIAITFDGPLGRYLNTRLSGLVFKQLPRDPANVNASKTMVDPYLFKCFLSMDFYHNAQYDESQHILPSEINCFFR